MNIFAKQIKDFYSETFLKIIIKGSFQQNKFYSIIKMFYFPQCDNNVLFY